VAEAKLAAAIEALNTPGHSEMVRDTIDRWGVSGL
jgi:hypothetical protein